jgi:hypothetical protein
MGEALLKEIDDLKEADFYYSNFDHQMPDDAEAMLREGKLWMEHTALNFWGAIWFQDGKFHEDIFRRRTHLETVTQPTLPDLIKEVNSRYGAD